jgi:hypothetical protein
MEFVSPVIARMTNGVIAMKSGRADFLPEGVADSL